MFGRDFRFNSKRHKITATMASAKIVRHLGIGGQRAPGAHAKPVRERGYLTLYKKINHGAVVCQEGAKRRLG